MVVIVAYLLISGIHHCYHDVWIVLRIKDQSYYAQNIRAGEISNRLFETYKNYFIPHGKNIFNTESGMAIITMCAYS